MTASKECAAAREKVWVAATHDGAYLVRHFHPALGYRTLRIFGGKEAAERWEFLYSLDLLLREKGEPPCDLRGVY